LDFVDAIAPFETTYLEASAKTVDGERRHLAVGFVDAGLATVVLTNRNELIRLRSMPRSRRAERRRHQALHG
jgi:uncharacterized DUF497 family protein